MLRILSQVSLDLSLGLYQEKPGSEKAEPSPEEFRFRKPISSLRGKFGARLAPPVVPN
jgi:hypothetical protein